MLKKISSKVLHLRQRKGIVFSKDMALDVLNHYGRYVHRIHLDELAKILLSSLKDGALRVFGGVPGAGKSKTLRLYGALGLLRGGDVYVSSPTKELTLKNINTIRGIASAMGINYRGKVRMVPFSGLIDIEVSPCSLILIDEAGFLNVKAADNLLSQACSTDSMLVMTGDVYQIGISPVDNGFIQIIKAMNKERFKVRELRENFRQRNKEDANAVIMLRDKKISKAMDYYRRRNAFKVFCNESQMQAQLVKDIRKVAHNDIMVMACTHVEMKVLQGTFRRAYLKAPVLTLEQAQGRVANQSFVIISQKNIKFNELLVAFSRHRYKITIYINGEAGIDGVSSLVKSVENLEVI